MGKVILGLAVVGAIMAAVGIGIGNTVVATIGFVLFAFGIIMPRFFGGG